MAAAWPSTLPCAFLMGTHQEGVGDGLIRSQPEMGPAMVRRRSSAMPRPLSGRLRMTGEQTDALRSFIETDLLGGSLPFGFPDQRGGPARLVRLREMPMFSRMTASRWEVSLSLEIMP